MNLSIPEMVLYGIVLFQWVVLFQKITRRAVKWFVWKAAYQKKLKQKPISEEEILAQVFGWLKRAHTAVKHRGFSMAYVLGHGWQASHPEVSGYTVSSLQLLARHWQESNPEQSKACDEMCRNTAQWFQNDLYRPGHGYGGWKGEGKEWGGLVFDTGQILHGLLSVYQRKPEYCQVEKIKSAADWLTTSLFSDGNWHTGTYWGGQAVEYYLRVTWALTRAARILKQPKYAVQAKRNFHFFLSRLSQTAWDGYLLVRNAQNPYLFILHFYAYTIQAAIECGAYFQNEFILRLAERALRTLQHQMKENHRLPGSINRLGRGDYSFRCVSGELQVAICAFRYAQLRGLGEFRDFGEKVLRQAISATCVGSAYPKKWRGSVWGSLPIYGKYQPWAQITWGAKFLVDALLISRSHTPELSLMIQNGELA